MKVLVIAEHNGQSISAATRCAITAAQAISNEVVCLVAGEGGGSDSRQNPLWAAWGSIVNQGGNALATHRLLGSSSGDFPVRLFLRDGPSGCAETRFGRWDRSC